MIDKPNDVDALLEAAFSQELTQEPDPELTAAVMRRIQRRERLLLLTSSLIALAATFVLLPAAESLYGLVANFCERLLNTTWTMTHLAAIATGVLGLAWLFVEEPI